MKPPERRRSEPKHTERTAADKATREARVAEEMRKNLLKRKAQRRARGDAGRAD